jgi:transcriptional repressor NrdR
VNCPFCGAPNTRVIDSRHTEDNSIRRRRLCDKCHQRFTTYEKIETIQPMVIKKDNTREPYDRSKIEAGILSACHKRPVSPKQIDALVDSVEEELFGSDEREIPTSAIGELVMKKLKDLDEVAYVRFASVYRQFRDVQSFMQEMGKILDENMKKEQKH